MFCKNCGKETDPDSKFCQYCGSQINELNGFDIKAKKELVKNSRIKCANCRYIGNGLSGRSKWGSILALLFIPFIPIITIIYFLVSHKFICPKCRSKFVEEIDEKGNIIKRRNVILIIILILVGVAVIGIFSSIVLVSISTARNKAKDAVTKANIEMTKVSAELHYNATHDYDGVCLTNDFKRISSEISKQGDTMICNDSLYGYCAQANLVTSGRWCADSNGYTGSEANCSAYHASCQ